MVSLLALYCLAWLSQDGNNSGRKKKEQPSFSDQGTQRGPVEFRAEVDQVVLHAAVYDKEDRLVTGLTKEDFSVFENKVKQQLTYFGQDDLPSTIGLVLDSSGSMRDKMEFVQKASHLFLDLSHPENELFLVDFDDEVVLEEDFTHDVEDIRDALDNIIVSGGTALYDAIYLAVERAHAGSEPKKAAVVFTDGEDRDSYYKFDELIDKIRESEVQVHIVAILDRDLKSEGGFFGIFKSEREKVKEKISSIATETGGKALFADEVEELEGAFRGIAEELRKQYRLSYTSSLPKDGTWREIDVVVNGAKEKGYKVRARKGYLAAK